MSSQDHSDNSKDLKLENDELIVKRGRSTVRRSNTRIEQALRNRATGRQSIHPGLIPGISVEDTGRKFPTNIPVFVIAFIVTVLVIVWAFFSPESLKMTGTTMQNWVVNNVSWGYTTLMIGTLIFMLVIGFGPTGRIRLGADDAEPEFFTASWVSMLFAAGLGIGLIFYGPMEPLTHYLNGSPAFDHLEPGTPEMVQSAMAQANLGS